MKIKGQISILINRESTTIKLVDDDASVTFAVVTLTPEQLSSALSRLVNTDCEIDVNHLNKIGKKMENKSFEFLLPDNFDRYTYTDVLRSIAQDEVNKLGQDWIVDSYFSSQNTFFTKDKKNYVRCTIRRWV
jgi:hypothetical protein